MKIHANDCRVVYHHENGHSLTVNELLELAAQADEAKDAARESEKLAKRNALQRAIVKAKVDGRFNPHYKIIGVKDAAAVLGIHPESVRRLVRQGKLKAYRNSGLGVMFFDKEYLLNFSKFYDNKTGNRGRWL